MCRWVIIIMIQCKFSAIMYTKQGDFLTIINTHGIFSFFGATFFSMMQNTVH